MKLAQWQMHSKIGPLFLVASEKGLQSLFWQEQPVPMLNSLNELHPAAAILAQAVNQLDEYFKGQRKNFDLPLDLEGTEFQKRVWQELCQIPYGKTISYLELSHRIGNPKAVRAVGSSNGKNPVCIIVPCHRVIASSGSLGGYSGGLPIKEKLLAIEKSTSSI